MRDMKEPSPALGAESGGKATQIWDGRQAQDEEKSDLRQRRQNVPLMTFLRRSVTEISDSPVRDNVQENCLYSFAWFVLDAPYSVRYSGNG